MPNYRGLTWRGHILARLGNLAFMLAAPFDRFGYWLHHRVR